MCTGSDGNRRHIRKPDSFTRRTEQPAFESLVHDGDTGAGTDDVRPAVVVGIPNRHPAKRTLYARIDRIGDPLVGPQTRRDVAKRRAGNDVRVSIGIQVDRRKVRRLEPDRLARRTLERTRDVHHRDERLVPGANHEVRVAAAIERDARDADGREVDRSRDDVKSRPVVTGHEEDERIGPGCGNHEVHTAVAVKVAGRDRQDALVHHRRARSQKSVFAAGRDDPDGLPARRPGNDVGDAIGRNVHTKHAGPLDRRSIDRDRIRIDALRDAPSNRQPAARYCLDNVEVSVAVEVGNRGISRLAGDRGLADVRPGFHTRDSHRCTDRTDNGNNQQSDADQARKATPRSPCALFHPKPICEHIETILPSLSQSVQPSQRILQDRRTGTDARATIRLLPMDFPRSLYREAKDVTERGLNSGSLPQMGQKPDQTDHQQQ